MASNGPESNRSSRDPSASPTVSGEQFLPDLTIIRSPYYLSSADSLPQSDRDALSRGELLPRLVEELRLISDPAVAQQLADRFIRRAYSEQADQFRIVLSGEVGGRPYLLPHCQPPIIVVPCSAVTGEVGQSVTEDRIAAALVLAIEQSLQPELLAGETNQGTNQDSTEAAVRRAAFRLSRAGWNPAALLELSSGDSKLREIASVTVGAVERAGGQWTTTEQLIDKQDPLLVALLSRSQGSYMLEQLAARGINRSSQANEVIPVLQALIDKTTEWNWARAQDLMAVISQLKMTEVVSKLARNGTIEESEVKPDIGGLLEAILKVASHDAATGLTLYRGFGAAMADREVEVPGAASASAKMSLNYETRPLAPYGRLVAIAEAHDAFLSASGEKQIRATATAFVGAVERDPLVGTAEGRRFLALLCWGPEESELFPNIDYKFLGHQEVALAKSGGEDTLRALCISGLVTKELLAKDPVQGVKCIGAMFGVGEEPLLRPPHLQNEVCIIKLNAKGVLVGTPSIEDRDDEGKMWTLQSLVNPITELLRQGVDGEASYEGGNVVVLAKELLRLIERPVNTADFREGCSEAAQELLSPDLIWSNPDGFLELNGGAIAGSPTIQNNVIDLLRRASPEQAEAAASLLSRLCEHIYSVSDDGAGRNPLLMFALTDRSSPLTPRQRLELFHRSDYLRMALDEVLVREGGVLVLSTDSSKVAVATNLALDLHSTLHAVLGGELVPEGDFEDWNAILRLCEAEQFRAIDYWREILLCEVFLLSQQQDPPVPTTSQCRSLLGALYSVSRGATTLLHDRWTSTVAGMLAPILEDIPADFKLNATSISEWRALRDAGVYTDHQSQGIVSGVLVAREKSGPSGRQALLEALLGAALPDGPATALRSPVLDQRQRRAAAHEWADCVRRSLEASGVGRHHTLGDSNYRQALQPAIDFVTRRIDECDRALFFAELLEAVEAQADLCTEIAGLIPDVAPLKYARVGILEAVGSDLSQRILSDQKISNATVEFLCSPCTDWNQRWWADMVARTGEDLEGKEALKTSRSVATLLACSETLWRNFRDAPEEVRAALLSQLRGVASGGDDRRSISDHISYVLDQLLRWDAGERRTLEEPLKALLLSQGEHVRLAIVSTLLASMAWRGEERRGTTRVDVPRTLLQFVTGLGLLETKVLQDAASSPAVSASTAQVWQEAKFAAREEPRWQWLRRIYETLPGAETAAIAHVGRPLGDASCFRTVGVTMKNGEQRALQLLLPKAAEFIDSGERSLRSAVSNMKGAADRGLELALLSTTLDRVANRARVEINSANWEAQCAALVDQFDGYTVTVRGTVHHSHSMRLIAHGKDYRWLTLVPGRRQIELPRDSVETRERGLAVAALWLRAKVEGKPVDQNRHGGNGHEDTIDEARHSFAVDPGGIPVQPPSEGELRWSGNVLNYLCGRSSFGGALSPHVRAFATEVLKRCKLDGSEFPVALMDEEAGYRAIDDLLSGASDDDFRLLLASVKQYAASQVAEEITSWPDVQEPLIEITRTQ